MHYLLRIEDLNPDDESDFEPDVDYRALGEDLDAACERAVEILGKLPTGVRIGAQLLSAEVVQTFDVLRLVETATAERRAARQQADTRRELEELARLRAKYPDAQP